MKNLFELYRMRSKLYEMEVQRLVRQNCLFSGCAKRGIQMKNTFPGYYQLSEEEFKELWNECIFVFDTNILLNLYRYSSETTEEFTDLMREISDRIWIPHQVGYEYQKDRLGVINAEEKSYDDLINLIDKTHEDLENRLSSKRHPYLKDSDIQIGKLVEIFDEIKSQLKEKKNEYVQLYDEDRIRDKLTELFAGKVGSPYSKQKIEEICKTGKKRYDKKIPPGYMDLKKIEPEKYGDLILWFQAIDKVKKENKPIILITDEKKEDWWQIHKEKRIGPRPELVQEMMSKTKLPCYIYRAFPFMEYARKYLKKDIKQQAIDEVKEVWERDEKEMLREGIMLSDSVSAEVFRPSAPDAVRALKLDAIDYAVSSSNSYEELVRNMGAFNQLKDALSHSDSAKRIIEESDPLHKITQIMKEMDHVDNVNRIFEEMDYAGKATELATKGARSLEHIKDMNIPKE